MKKYWAYIKASLLLAITHKWQVFWEVAGSVFTLIFYILLWTAVYGSSDTIGGMTLPQVIQYYAMVQIITALTLTRADRTISREISGGGILNRLIRPSHVYGQVLGAEIGDKLWKLFSYALPVLLAALCFIRFSLPKDVWPYPLFILSLILALLIGYNINFMAGISAAWVTGSEGITHTKDFLASIATGALLPLSFYPSHLQQLFACLPFQYMLYVPYQILSGSVTASAALLLLLQATLWVTGLSLINLALLKRGIRRIAIYGG